MIAILLGIAVWYLLLFVSAGRLDWPAAWANVAIGTATLAFNKVYVGRRNPELLAQRWKHRKDAKRFDKVIGAFFLPFAFALPVLAGLGVRWNWPALPSWSIWPGAALILAGTVPITWSMAVNPHLETVVRIQRDRGHKVITGGPYRWVRHPMYFGTLLQQSGHAMMFGPLAGFAPAVGIAILLIVRTALEDRTLQAELPGYRDYAQTTRYRLVPLVW